MAIDWTRNDVKVPRSTIYAHDPIDMLAVAKWHAGEGPAVKITGMRPLTDEEREAYELRLETECPCCGR